MKKSGAHFDLPIAIGMLTAWNICKPHPDKRYLLAGELSLTGELLPINGALLMAIAARAHQLTGIILPVQNEEEAKLVTSTEVVGFSTLTEVVQFLNGEFVPTKQMPPKKQKRTAPPLNFGEVRGQPIAKRALEIAAAGGHNILMVGTPGSGKTMLAERLPTILPPLTSEEKLETMKVLSLHGLLHDTILSDERPFRAPHHSASYAGLIGGGGGIPKLGEISLAHNGVLFMDELAEFNRNVLEVLRQPLESGLVRLVRTGASVTYPARFMLVAAMNPCPCGYYGHPKRACICNMHRIQHYRRKVSGPLIDRIDIHIEVEPVPHKDLMGDKPTETSEMIKQRVLAARKIQEARYDSRIGCNAQLHARDLKKFCPFKGNAESLLEKATEKMHLSARSTHRVLKIARTIADLESSDALGPPHIAEALQYRPTDDVH